MKKFTSCILVTGLAIASLCAQSTIVIDRATKEPISLAVVFSANGSIKGTTDNNGICREIEHSDYPVTIKCLGYKQKVCVGTSDTVFMEQDFHELGEVVVTPGHRPIMNVLCYIREYTSGGTSTDTVQYFAEHMAMFYIPQGKVKGFKASNSPQVLRSKLYQRNIRNGRDSVFKPDYRPDDISWLDLVSYPEKNVQQTDRISQGANIDTIMGKHYIKTIARKTDKLYFESTDVLADKKDHRMSPLIFKMLGMTIDFNAMNISRAYRVNKSGLYKPEDMAMSTLSVEIVGKGKWIKKAFNSKDPVAMNGLFEIYPIKIDYLTIDEAKNMLYENPPKVKFQRSEQASVLPSGIQYIMRRADDE